MTIVTSSQVAISRRPRDAWDESILRSGSCRAAGIGAGAFTATGFSRRGSHCPGIMKAAKQLSAAVEASGRLPGQLLALVYLRVALINGCPF